MESRHPDHLAAVSRELVDALFHLPCCLVRKGNREDVVRLDMLILDQIRHPVRQYPCLAAARARKDQHRTFGLCNALKLVFI